jgi:heme ABC exporter ATP-binding subunit CcmA/heme exporter protein CcmB
MAASHTPEVDPPPALEARGLTRRFGPTIALRDVDLALYAGECVALVGPNGAGKTTLLRALTGVLRPTRGAVQVDGQDLAAAPALRRCVGYVGHGPCLYGDLTARENLRFYGRIYGVPTLEARIEEVLDELAATAVADRPVRTLSRGTQQRVSLARAILHEPPVLLLDEPDTGLDQDTQIRVAALLRRWTSEGRAVLFTSHRLEWAETVADRAIVLRNGRIGDAIAGPPPLALAARYADVLGAPPQRLAVERSSEEAATSVREPAAPFVHSGAPRRSAPAPAAAPGILPQLLALVAKDVLLEWRTKDAVAAMLVFALLTLVTFNFALDLRPEVMATVGPGVLWVAVVFGSMLGPGRGFIREQEAGTLEGLLLAPLDRSGLFLAKLAGNLLVMAAVEAVSVPALIALFDVRGAIGPVALVLVAGTVGLGAVETLLAAVAAHTRAREVMLPVLLLPIMVPIVIGVVQATSLALGSTTAHDLPWLGLILAFDAMYLATGVAVFEYVLEE